jgi:hypothetical protein
VEVEVEGSDHHSHMRIPLPQLVVQFYVVLAAFS